MENEKLCKRYDVPFQLLHDPGSSVSEALELEFSPVFYFLNSEGAIVYDGNLKTGAEYWSVLAALDGNKTES